VIDHTSPATPALRGCRHRADIKGRGIGHFVNDATPNGGHANAELRLVFPGDKDYPTGLLWRKQRHRLTKYDETIYKAGRPVVFVVATKDIMPDDEVFIDYPPPYWADPSLACYLADPGTEFAWRINATTEVTSSTGGFDIDKRQYTVHVLDYGRLEHGKNEITYSLRQLVVADKLSLVGEFESGRPETAGFGAALKRLGVGIASPIAKVVHVCGVWAQKSATPASDSRGTKRLGSKKKKKQTKKQKRQPVGPGTMVALRPCPDDMGVQVVGKRANWCRVGGNTNAEGVRGHFYRAWAFTYQTVKVTHGTTAMLPEGVACAVVCVGTHRRSAPSSKPTGGKETRLMIVCSIQGSQNPQQRPPKLYALYLSDAAGFVKGAAAALEAANQVPTTVLDDFLSNIPSGLGGNPGRWEGLLLEASGSLVRRQPQDVPPHFQAAHDQQQRVAESVVHTANTVKLTATHIVTAVAAKVAATAVVPPVVPGQTEFQSSRAAQLAQSNETLQIQLIKQAQQASLALIKQQQASLALERTDRLARDKERAVTGAAEMKATRDATLDLVKLLIPRPTPDDRAMMPGSRRCGRSVRDDGDRYGRGSGSYDGDRYGRGSGSYDGDRYGRGSGSYDGDRYGRGSGSGNPEYMNRGGRGDRCLRYDGDQGDGVMMISGATSEFMSVDRRRGRSVRDDGDRYSRGSGSYDGDRDGRGSVRDDGDRYSRGSGSNDGDRDCRGSDSYDGDRDGRGSGSNDGDRDCRGSGSGNREYMHGGGRGDRAPGYDVDRGRSSRGRGSGDREFMHDGGDARRFNAGHDEFRRGSGTDHDYFATEAFADEDDVNLVD
jgi:hypothetical protein